MTRFFDNHAHSYFSTDSEMDIREAVRTAYEKGLAGIALTDHMDYDAPKGAKPFLVDVPAQQSAIDMVVEEMGLNGRGGQYGDFRLCKGIEIGLQDVSMEKIDILTKTYKFDSIIASLHFIDGHDPYYRDYYRGLDYFYAYSHYLDVIYTLLKQNPDFDILGHYDYVARYPDYPQACIRYSEFKDYIEPILVYLVEHGKTLEINTKTYSITRAGQKMELDLDILRRFCELGGEAVSLGSDAHATSHIANLFPWARQVALAAGLKYEVYFVDRQPQYIKL